MLPAMGLFYVSDLMGGAKNLLIGNVIKVQFLNIRDWPFGAATSITLTIVMGLMLLIYWRINCATLTNPHASRHEVYSRVNFMPPA